MMLSGILKTGIDSGFRFGRCGLILLVIIAAACSEINQETDAIPADVSQSTPISAPVLHDETLERGLAFSHLQGEDQLTGIHETLGAGACAFDYNNDGWTDLFLVNGSGLTRFYGQQHWWSLNRGHALFRNDGGHFVDVTKESGLDVIDWSMGCATADLDNDGDRDLFLANYGKNRLFRNNGDGTFTDVTAAAGITGSAWSTGAAIADYNGDGLADIYVVNYIDFEPGARTFEGEQQFQRTVPRSFNPGLFNSIGNRLYQNQGDLTFKDVTVETGTADNGGRGLMAQWLDIDGNGQLDLLIANDVASPLGLYLNKDNRFVPGGERYRLNTAVGVRGITVDDINADGSLDLAIGTADGYPPVLLIQQPEAVDAKRFTDNAWELLMQARAAATGSTYGLAAEDFNADGNIDLFLANGFTHPDQDVARLPQGQGSVLLVNNGKQFLASEIFDDPGVMSARAVAVADFDNNGLPDIYVTHNNDMGRLLMNRTPNPGAWLSLELVDDIATAGAVVTVTTEGMQRARLYGASGLFNNASGRLHFGLGESPIADIQVRWPDGEIDSFNDIAVNQHYRITRSGIEAHKLPQPDAATAPFPLVIGANRPGHRAAYVRWRLEAGFTAERKRLFNIALEDPAAVVRQTALEIAAETPHHEWLAGVLSVMNHPEPAMRVAALHAAQAFEAESSIRWVIPRLDDPNSRVRARAAELFRYWFSEDEAVIQRKYLALPILIRHLDDPDPQVRLTVIQALGEAERYRAMQPLVALLNDKSADIRAAAATALGRIRETGAQAALKTILYNPAEKPAVRAAALIALERLGASSVLENFSVRETDSNIELAVLKALLADKGRTVIARDRITAALRTLAPNSQPMFVEVLCANGDAAALPLLEPALHSPDNILRAHAWQCAFSMQPQRTAKIWAAAKKDHSPRVQRAAFRRYLQSGKIPGEALQHASHNPVLRFDALMALVQRSNKRAAQQLLTIAASDTATAQARRDALRALTKSGIGLADATNFHDHKNESVRVVALRLWARSLPAFVKKTSLPTPIQTAINDPSLDVRRAAVDVLINRHEAWAVETLQKLLLHDGAIAIQRHIIDNVWRRAGDTGVKLLLPIIAAPIHPLYPAAVKTLSRIDTPESVSLLFDILADTQNPDDLRFAAAQALWKHSPKQVRTILEAPREIKNEAR